MPNLAHARLTRSLEARTKLGRNDSTRSISAVRSGVGPKRRSRNVCSSAAVGG